MKKFINSILVFGFIGLSLTTVFAFSRYREIVEDEKSRAAVEQIDNVYVFYQCKPVSDFETVGQVKAGLTLKGSPDELLHGLISNAKKKFPSCDGILIGDIGMSRADAIKFK